MHTDPQNEVDVILTLLGVGTQRELARLCGIGKQAVTNWRRKGQIPLRQRVRLADHARTLGVDLTDWALGRSNVAS